MKLIKNREFGGERPLYCERDLRLEDVVIHAGESALKETANIEAVHCRFEGKYPLWCCDGFTVRDSILSVGARAGIWYSRNMLMEDCLIDAPKTFREMDGMTIRRVRIDSAAETFWHCRGGELEDVTASRADYIFMHCSGLKIKNLKLQGNYSFQWARDIEIRDSDLDTKDAFWETENVTVYDSRISGEYLGWHSRGLRLVRCHISGPQPLCYASGLVLEDCTFDPDADLAFEYSDVQATVRGHVTSIKNPRSGQIRVGSCGELILDDHIKAPGDCLVSEGYGAPRLGSGCVKWDARFPKGVNLTPEQRKRLIPLWVADMDFPAAPVIRKALQKRLDHGVFGYTCVPDSYYEAVRRWYDKRHHLSIEKDWILYTTGVVPALSAVIKALAKPGEGVILQSPVYNCFFSSIRNNGCRTVDVPLLRKDLPDGRFTYGFDYEGLEKACADPSNRVLLLCSPHNPAGRVYTPEELRRIGDIALKHGVAIIADEIHCEILAPGQPFTPFASLGEACRKGSVTLSSPSKGFNITGLQTANIICPDSAWRTRIDRALNDNEICDVGPFGPVALEAAYSDEGKRWLDENNARVQRHYQLLLERFRRELPMLPVCVLEGTYLAWVDISALGISSTDLEVKLLNECQVWVNAGSMYGTDGYIRINLACPTAQLQEGLDRMIYYLSQ